MLNEESIDELHYDDGCAIQCPFCGSEFNHIYELRVTRGDKIDVLSGKTKHFSENSTDDEKQLRGSRIRTMIICESCNSLYYLTIQFYKGAVQVFTEKTKTMNIPTTMFPEEFYRN